MSNLKRCQHTGEKTNSILKFPFGEVNLVKCAKCGDLQGFEALFEKCPRCGKPFPLKRGKPNKTIIPCINNPAESGIHIFLDSLWACFACATEIMGKALQEEFAKP